MKISQEQIDRVEQIIRREILAQAENVYFWDMADVELFMDYPRERQDFELKEPSSTGSVELYDRFDLKAVARAVLESLL